MGQYVPCPRAFHAEAARCILVRTRMGTRTQELWLCPLGDRFCFFRWEHKIDAANTFFARWSIQNTDTIVPLTFRPCRQEMIDIENLYQRFKKQNLVILAISSEQREQVEKFVKALKITFPVLLDPEQKVAQLYKILGVPKSFVYDRESKLTAQAIDVRTQKQLLNMLQKAGL
jgi:peroxiredoxin